MDTGIEVIAPRGQVIDVVGVDCQLKVVTYMILST